MYIYTYIYYAYVSIHPQRKRTYTHAHANALKHGIHMLLPLLSYQKYIMCVYVCMCVRVFVCVCVVFVCVSCTHEVLLISQCQLVPVG